MNRHFLNEMPGSWTEEPEANWFPAQLPIEIITSILAQCELEDMFAFRRTCKALNGASYGAEVWSSILQRQAVSWDVPDYFRYEGTLSSEELERRVTATYRFHTRVRSTPLTTKMPDLFPSPLVILELDSIANIIHEQGVQGFDPRSTDDHYPTSSTHGNDTTPIRERRLKPIATKRVYSIRGTWRAVCIGAGGNWALAVCDDHLQLWDIGNYEDSCAGTVIASLPIGVANESSIFLQWDLVNSASSGGTMVGLSEEEEESIPGSKHSIFHIDWTGQPTITYVFSHETIEASDLRVHSSGLPLINEQGRTTYIWDIRSGFKEENAVVLRAEEWADECVIYDKFLLRFTLPITGVVEIFRLPFPLTTQPDHTSVSSESYLLGTYNWIEDAETDIKYGRAFKCARSFTRSPQIGEDDQPTAIFFVCAEYALDVTIVWQKGVYLPSDELGTPQVSTLRRIVRGSPFSGDRFPAYPILEIGHASWLWWLNSDQELATIGTEIATYVAEFGDKDDQGRTSVAHEHSALLDLGSIKPSGLLNWNSVDFDVHSGRIVAPDRNILYIFDYV